jgi:L-threonylcarbamoyladenylate synthase
MKRLTVGNDKENIAVIKQAVEILKAGGVVALPTETVYGVGVISSQPQAVKRLYELKQRDYNKPFSLCVSAPEEVANFFQLMPPFGYRLIEKLIPGPITIIFYKKNSQQKVGLRVPISEITTLILKQLNKPIYLASANISNQPEAVSAQEVEDIFDGNLDLIVDDCQRHTGLPSTVIDLTQHPYKVLRSGAVDVDQLKRLFFKKRITFVCTGNICRSAMAEYILKNIFYTQYPFLFNRFEVLSRGILSLPDQGAHFKALHVLGSMGIDAGPHQARSVDRKTLLSSDYIFVMERRHKKEILDIEPALESRTFMLGQFLPGAAKVDIKDPIGKSSHFFQDTYYLLDKAIRELIGWLV